MCQAVVSSETCCHNSPPKLLDEAQCRSGSMVVADLESSAPSASGSKYLHVPAWFAPFDTSKQGEGSDQNSEQSYNRLHGPASEKIPKIDLEAATLASASQPLDILMAQSSVLSTRLYPKMMSISN